MALFTIPQLKKNCISIVNGPLIAAANISQPSFCRTSRIIVPRIYLACLLEPASYMGKLYFCPLELSMQNLSSFCQTIYAWLVRPLNRFVIPLIRWRYTTAALPTLHSSYLCPVSNVALTNTWPPIGAYWLWAFVSVWESIVCCALCIWRHGTFTAFPSLGNRNVLLLLCAG